VKRLNPGWDLLMNVDWDRELAAVAANEPAAVEAAVAAAIAAPASETVTITPKVAAAEPPAAVRPDGRLFAAAAVMLLAGVAFLWRSFRRQP
jgi:hypothetical protein